MLDKGMTHVLGGMEENGKRVHCVTWNTHGSIYKLFISGILHIIFLDWS